MAEQPGDFDANGFRVNHGGSKKESDPWSDETWGADALNTSLPEDQVAFEYTATASTEGESFEGASVFFPEHNERKNRADERQDRGGAIRVQIAIHEQLSTLYDDVNPEPISSVQGSIYAKSSKIMTNPFCLLLRDPIGHIESVKERVEIAHNISSKIARQHLRRNDRVYRVSLSPTLNESLVATYECTPTIKVVPMLVKSRVQIGDKYSRVGFKIRANPSNQHGLRRVIIMIAIPLFVDGQSVRMSRKGGMWDELKRTLTWCVEKLEPGETLEIQTQFTNVGPRTESTVSFPVLLRADYPTLYSKVHVSDEYTDSLSVPVQFEVNKTGRVLHRKV